MLKRLISLGSITMVAAAAAVAAPASAQTVQGIRERKATVFTVTPYVGYMIFGDFLKGPVGTTLSTKNGPVYGAQVGVDIAPNITVLGNVGYSNSDLRIGVPIVGGVNVGSSKVWLYDGDIQFAFPMGERSSLPIKPFVQVGAGAMHYDISEAFLNTSSTNFAANAGVGVDIQAARNVGVRLMAKDYIGKFNFKDATGFDLEGKTAQNWALTAGVRLAF